MDGVGGGIWNLIDCLWKFSIEAEVVWGDGVGWRRGGLVDGGWWVQGGMDDGWKGDEGGERRPSCG